MEKQSLVPDDDPWSTKPTGNLGMQSFGNTVYVNSQHRSMGADSVLSEYDNQPDWKFSQHEVGSAWGDDKTRFSSGRRDEGRDVRPFGGNSWGDSQRDEGR